MNDRNKHLVINKDGFSLIEVVLAIGIFLVTVLALVGLLGPTLQSVNEVEKTDAVSSVVNTVNSFLHNSPAIASGSNFETVFNALKKSSDSSATLFVYQAYREDNSEAVKLRVGFDVDVSVADKTKGRVVKTDLSDAAGSIYRVVLTPSSVLPVTGQNASGTDVSYRSATRSSTTNAYSLIVNFNDYMEGSFAMEVHIYAEDPGPTFIYSKSLEVLKDEEPIFTYNIAIVR
jgi:Tfp pilus assembly protein PilV